MGLVVLVSAPRTPAIGDGEADPPDAPDAPTDRLVLTVENVELLSVSGFPFEMDENTQIRLRIDVNGNVYNYPNLDGVDWVRTGPIMAAQWFNILPNESGYDIRFEGDVREGEREARLVNLETVRHDDGPVEARYELYPVDTDQRARGAIPVASIRYTLTAN